MAKTSRPYVKVATDITEHPKVLNVRREYRWAYIEMLCYAARNLTDGFIPADYAHRFCGTSETSALKSAGLVHPTDGGYVIHDYLDWQTSAERVRQTSEKRAASGSKGGKQSGSNRASKREANATARTNIEVRSKNLTSTEVPMLTADAASDFDAFWHHYPRKVGKATARKAFDKARKRAPAGLIVAGCKRMSADPNLPADRTLIPHPTTWLNRDGWEDEPYPPQTNGRKQSGTNLYAVIAGELT